MKVFNIGIVYNTVVFVLFIQSLSAGCEQNSS